ncbi:MAG: LPS-assembly protein LptD [Aliarcobacter sp.]|nr:LPS-assembly protein LptD [Aliarcobacter sp.]
MHKKIIASLLITSYLIHAQELKNEKFQLVAKNVDALENIVTASGNVVIYSPTYYLSANKVIYNKENETFELFDNVLVIKDNNIQTQSNYAFIDLKKDSSNQYPMFLREQNNKIWINSKTSNKEKEEIDLDSSIISSCDCLDPVWSIRASSADYDTESKWINAYNPRLYLKNVPVFYSPYLGFPTDTTRRTGLLLPTIGYSAREGLLYSQPIFIAPADNYDIELVPQTRTKRGSGAYAYYRYADSPDSVLKIKTGIFKENENYFLENQLQNQEHYGFDLDYQRREMFSKNNSHDGLFTSIKYLNDIEYITLADDTVVTSTDRKVESKVNYFYDTPEYYGGAYGRYYIDGSKTSNKGTLQELPQVQFHSYNKETFIDNLIYSADTKVINYTRPEGLSANVYEISVPVSYSEYFIDDYIYAFAENKTIISKYDYSNFNTINYEDGTLIQNITSVGVGSNLIKPYEEYLHTLNLIAEYIVPKNLKENGDLYNITTVDNSTKENELRAFPISQEQKNIKLSANQSLYDNSDLKQLINHKISQSILYDQVDNPKLQDLENYLRVNHEYGSISGKTVYNVEDGKNVENSATSVFTYNELSLTVGYYQSKKTQNIFNSREDLESYRFDVGYKLAKDYRVSYYENYDLLENIRNRQGISLNIDDSCWNFDLKYEDQITPTSSLNSDGIQQQVIYATILLKPLGGIKQKYKMQDSN